jgi:Zn-dependent peptidase ImmA (M78 family)
MAGTVIADLSMGLMMMAEAARELGVSRQAVAKMVRRGWLTGASRNGREYVTAHSVKAERARREKLGLLKAR